MIRNATCFGLAVLVMGCSEPGPSELFYPAFVTPIVPSPIEVGGWTLTLDEASVMFGPAYFCAAATGAATLCTTAIAEIRQVSLIDARDSTPQRIGDVHGFTGTIRSASYDHGIHWFITESAPKADSLAPGGHSAVFVGQARRGGQTISFDARIDLQPPLQGERAVTRILTPVVIENENVTLDITFDIAEWLSSINFDAAAIAGADSLFIEPSSTAHSGIVSAMSNIAPPEFVWSGAGVGTP
jgi:hypothetical protein